MSRSPTDASLRWQSQFADVFEELPAERRDSLIAAVQSNVIEGFEPTREDLELLVDVAAGRMTPEELIDSFRQGRAQH